MVRTVRKTGAYSFGLESRPSSQDVDQKELKQACVDLVMAKDNLCLYHKVPGGTTIGR